MADATTPSSSGSARARRAPGSSVREPGPPGAASPEAPRRRADPRLPAYLLAGLGALVAAVATGQAGLATLAAPFLALAAAGLAGREAAGLRGEVSLSRDRVIEGDAVEGEVHLDWDGAAEVDVLLTDGRGVAPMDPAPVTGWSLEEARGPVSLPFRLRARSWGRHDPGTLWVRVRRPGGLVVWERKLAGAPTLHVLPAPLRLDRLLKPSEPRAVAGMHLSRLRGHGTDFAELRPYRPGDRLRDISWATSARLGEPWVTVHHPERTGTVLLLLDAFFGGERGSTEALARAARAAWAVASAHLRVQDRVGLLARGRTTAWLPPRGGRRARWLLVAELLKVGGAAEDPRRRRHHGRRVVVPADALVVGVTGLRSRIFVRDLLHYRRTGHATVALVIDTADLLPDASDRVESGGPRLWVARPGGERDGRERGGGPPPPGRPAAGVGPAISALRRRTRASRQPVRTGAPVR